MARLLLALAVFLAGLSGGAYWLLAKRGANSSNKANKSEVSGKSGGGSDAFFYGAIGAGEGDGEVETQAEGDGGRKGGGKATFTLELKVTGDRTAAEALIDELQGRGVEAYYTPLSRAGRVVYRVRRGMFTNKKDADKAAAQFKVATALEAKVIKLQ